MASDNYKEIFHKTYELYIKSKSKEDKKNYEMAKRNYESYIEIKRILQNKNDFYKVMNVLKTASEEDIKTAYKKLARQIHPNACKIEQCEEAFKIVNEAKETLCDKNKRAIYDQKDNPFNSIVFNTGHTPYDFTTSANFNDFFSRCNFEQMDNFLTPEDIFYMTMNRIRRPRRQATYREQEDSTVGLLFNLQEKTLASTIFNICLYNGVENLIFLPFEIFSTFYVEAKYGFNKTTVGTFIGDIIKRTIVTFAITYGIYYAGIRIIMNCKNIVIPLLVFLIVVQLVLITIAPTVILPLFNKFTELPKNELYADIEDLAKKNNFPLQKIYEMDGSKRSGHSNAFFLGFFAKQIVLFDTLLKQLSNRQIVAVMCHEIAHWKYSHIIKNMIFLIGYELILLHCINNHLVRDAFLCINLIYTMQFFGDIFFFISYFKNYMSRIFELQADSYAVECGYGEDLIDALEILEKENKSPQKIDRLYSTYYYSHPPVKERAAEIKKLLQKKQ